MPLKIFETLTEQERLQRIIDMLTKWRDNPRLLRVEAKLVRADLEPRIEGDCIVYQTNPDFSIIDIHINIRTVKEKP